jgi:glycosyltransferase involved in cell wall biosynthesis
MGIPISGVVLTKNEEDEIAACLESISWVDEILVVDSFSTDKTVEIAKPLATRVLQHPFKNFAAQRNYAQLQAKFDWVLFIDADERVSPELRDEIQALAQSGKLANYNAYHIRRVHLFSGKWFGEVKKIKLTPKLGKTIRKNEVPRLYNRNQATWERALHEQVIVPEPHEVLEGAILHYATSNLSRTLEDFNYFTDLEAARLHALHGPAKRCPSILEALLRGFRLFVYMYLGLGLYKLGEQGFLLSFIGAFTKFINYAKLSERIRIQNDRGTWMELDRNLLEHFYVGDKDE